MIGTVNAIWLACLFLLFTSIIGVAIGYLASLITRKPWGIRVAAADWTTAFAVAAIYALIASEILAARGIWENNIAVQTILAGAGSVIVKHLLQAAFRSRHRA